MERVRLVTLNLWGEQPPLARRMELAAAQLGELQPDVVTLQEVREVPGSVENMAETLGRALGMKHVFAPATPWGGGTEGLAILSRLPIVRHEARELPHATPTERRVCLGAALGTPQGELCVFTTHLHYRLTHGREREDQVAAVDEFAQSWATPLPRLLAGDFNATPDSDEIRFLRGLHTHAGRRTFWQDAWQRLHGRGADPGLTWASANPYTQRLRWLETDRRIDYVFASPMQRDGRGTIHDARVVCDEPAADGALPSDHFGVFAEIQIAPVA